MVPPELAHNLAIRYFSNYKKKETELDDPILNTNVCDLKFANPIGLAAGFDKNGKSFNGLFNLGFGFVEIGTITLKPQVGNKKPRIFLISYMNKNPSPRYCLHIRNDHRTPYSGENTSDSGLITPIS